MARTIQRACFKLWSLHFIAMQRASEDMHTIPVQERNVSCRIITNSTCLYYWQQYCCYFSACIRASFQWTINAWFREVCVYKRLWLTFFFNMWAWQFCSRKAFDRLLVARSSVVAYGCGLQRKSLVVGSRSSSTGRKLLISPQNGLWPH